MRAVVNRVGSHRSAEFKRWLGILVIVVAELAQFVDAVLHELLPQLLEPAHHFGVMAQDAEKNVLLHVGGCGIEVPSHIPDKISVLVSRVAKAPVQVPYRPKDELAARVQEVGVVAENALGIENFLVANQVAGHQVAGQVVDIDLFFQAATGGNRLDKGGESLLDDAQVQRGLVLAKLRLLDVDRQAIGIGHELLLLRLIIVGVQFQ